MVDTGLSYDIGSTRTCLGNIDTAGRRVAGLCICKLIDASLLERAKLNK